MRENENYRQNAGREKSTVEGMFTIVRTLTRDDPPFSPQNNGADTVKSPMGMFDPNEIDNDPLRRCHCLWLHGINNVHQIKENAAWATWFLPSITKKQHRPQGKVVLLTKLALIINTITEAELKQSEKGAKFIEFSGESDDGT